MFKRQAEQVDPGLLQIADLEAKIVLAHDQTMASKGIPEAERAALRHGVVTLAANIGERLRANYLAQQRATQEASRG